jgi:hypothetical protein
MVVLSVVVYFTPGDSSFTIGGELGVLESSSLRLHNIIKAATYRHRAMLYGT